jgi:hypothetical protein
MDKPADGCACRIWRSRLGTVREENYYCARTILIQNFCHFVLPFGAKIVNVATENPVRCTARAQTRRNSLRHLTPDIVGVQQQPSAFVRYSRCVRDIPVFPRYIKKPGIAGDGVCILSCCAAAHDQSLNTHQHASVNVEQVNVRLNMESVNANEPRHEMRYIPSRSKMPQTSYR